jgi:Bacterial pre-peptidase C-terminal domain
MRSLSIAVITVFAFITFGCNAQFQQDAADLDGQWVKSDPGKADSSAVAVFLDFEFDGELLTDSSWGTNSKIEDQLLYTVGQLNGDRSISRIDKLELTNIKTEADADSGMTKVTYHAKTVVAWGKRNNVPTSYDFVLPLNMSYKGQQTFIEAYKHDCVDYGAHDVDSGTMWYYWRPEAYKCKPEAADVITATASVSPSAIATTGKYPEYDKVWADKALKVVAVFGKYEDGATSSDAGISAYNRFVKTIKSLLGQKGTLTTVPAQVPSSPGVGTPDITFSVELDGGRKIEVVALLVDSVRSAGYAFSQRYEKLSRDADLIAYNGHSGLGANIRALARKGDWVKGQYVIVFMNGCDTYAYLDSALADAHKQVNSDDPNGTKYCDVVTNAMPSFFSNMAGSTVTLIKALLAFDAPKTYEKIFADISSSQVVLVSGEEDNTYVPGGDDPDDPPPVTWAGLSESGTLARGEEQRHQTVTLAKGKYLFALSGDNDADLYVRVGTAPTRSLYDCRPYKSGSAESCLVDLPAAAKIHVMVRGWASSSSFQLSGKAQD